MLRLTRRRLNLFEIPKLSRSRHTDANAAATSGDPLKTVLVIGTTRTKNIGDRVACFVRRELEDRGHDVSVLDPKTAHDGFFMNLATKHHFHYKDNEIVPLPLTQTHALLEAADAYVVVSPEMNHTISPAVTNTLNYFATSTYKNKVSGIATYSAGMWGGARSGVALRAYLSELGCLPVSATSQMRSAWMGKSWREGASVEDQVVPKIAEGTMGQLDAQNAANSFLEPAEAFVHSTTKNMLDQLEFYALALREQRRLL
jgi:NAD(P)H-dependent FMN reductase